MKRRDNQKADLKKTRAVLKGLLFSVVILALAFGSILGWPLFLQKAGAVEVTIDSSADTGSNSNQTPSPNSVFVSDDNGYVFYVEDDGTCVYAKTTNGGSTWGSPVTVDSQTDCGMPIVWYDRWTPGDINGTDIHIVNKDPGNDDLWYNRLDTSSDTLLLSSNPVAITAASGANKSNTFGAAANANSYPALTKGTDGDLYVAMQDNNVGAESYAIKCSSSCGTASSWSTAGSNWTGASIAVTNSTLLMPLPNANIIAINQNNSVDDIEYQIYTDSTNSWNHDSDAWDDIDTAAQEINRDGFGATVDPLTGDVFLAYIDVNTGGTGGNNNDIKTWTYSSGSWTQNGNVLTNDSKGPVGVKLGFNINNEDLYAVYVAEATAGTATSMNVYYKSSTNNMASWGTESSPLNAAQDEILGAFVNIVSNERIYTNWRIRDGANPDQIKGEVVADVLPPDYEMSAYRFFANVNSTDVGSSLAAQDSAATLPDADSLFRLRLLLHVDVEGARVNLDQLKLQFAVKSGSCDTGFSGETYADVTSSTAIAFTNNPSPSDGDNLTANGGDPTHSGDTIRNQDYEEANNFTTSVAAVAVGEDGKWDFALRSNGAPRNTSYCFRVVGAEGAIYAPTIVPELSSAPCQVPTTEQRMRGEGFFCGEGKYKNT